MKRRWSRDRRVLVLAVLLLSALILAGVVHAAGLTVRASTFAWNKADTLLGTFNFREAVDSPQIAKRLKNGLEVRIYMRGYVYPEAGGDPIALTATSCQVALSLWDGVYKVVRNSGKSKTVANLKGVYRYCTDMVDLPIADRATLKNNPSAYYLAVKVEVNPVSEDTMKKIQQWVTRPSPNSSIGPSDALFASFVGVFMKNIPTADLVIEFRTAAFPP